nr:hypothetical protein [Agromyces mangrovi]
MLGQERDDRRRRVDQVGGEQEDRRVARRQRGETGGDGGDGAAEGRVLAHERVAARVRSERRRADDDDVRGIRHRVEDAVEQGATAANEQGLVDPAEPRAATAREHDRVVRPHLAHAATIFALERAPFRSAPARRRRCTQMLRQIGGRVQHR